MLISIWYLVKSLVIDNDGDPNYIKHSLNINMPVHGSTQKAIY